jgi:hypothetical protein
LAELYYDIWMALDEDIACELGFGFGEVLEWVWDACHDDEFVCFAKFQM